MGLKGGTFTVTVVILLLIITFITISAPFATTFKDNVTVKDNIVDSGVDALFENQPEVSVIVILKDDYSSISISDNDKSKDAQEKEMVKAQREKVLGKLAVKEKSKASDYSDGYPNISASADYDLELTNTYSLVNGFAGKIKKSALEKLRKDPNVLGIYLNREVRAILDTSVPLVNATNLWPIVLNGQNITGNGETICIIDTGVDYTHTSMGACTNNTFLNGTCSKVIGGYDYVNSDADPMDDHNHGTHVAGIAASTNETYKGVAPDAKIVALKVLNSTGSGTDANVVNGIDWCVNNASKFNISVISMSLGGDTLYSSYCDSDNTADAVAIDNAIAKNISVIVAAGNDGSTTSITAPGCINNATTVSATHKTDGFQPYNRGNITDLLAPGSSITSLRRNGGSLTSSGTSMSTPHVAGAFALIHQFGRLERNINFTPYQIHDYLNKTGKRLNDTGNSTLIFSRIDVYSAARYIANVTINFSTATEGNGTSAQKNWIFINVTMNTSNFANITFGLYFQNGTLANATTYTIMNESNKRINFTPANISIVYLFNVTIYDSSTFSNSTETRQITLSTSPDISYSTGTEANNSYLNRNWLLVNVSISTIAFANITFSLMNSSFGLINTTTYTNQTTSINFTVNTSNAKYYFNVSLMDTGNQVNYTENRIVTLDNITPSLNFSTGSDANNSFITKSWIFVNVTASDTNFANITYYLYNVSNDTILINATTYTNLSDFNRTINFSLPNLNTIYLVNISVTDRANNVNSTDTRRIINDVTTPSIAFVSPSLGNNSYSNRNWIFINISFNEFNFNNITFILLNSSFSVNGSSLFTNATNSTNFSVVDSNTAYYMGVNISDKMNNVNITEFRLINLDTLTPSLTFTGGVENDGISLNRTWIFVNVSYSDTNFANVSFTLSYSNSTVINQTNLTSQITSLNFTPLTDGSYVYNVIVYDKANNQNSSGRSITLDTIIPTLSYAGGISTNSSFVNRNWTFVNVTRNDTNLANVTYYLYYANGTLLNETTLKATTSLSNITNSTKDTIDEGVTKTYTLSGRNYEVTADFIGSSTARFTINSYQTSSMVVGATQILNDSISQITLIKITSLQFGGGITRADINLSLFNQTNITVTSLNFTNLPEGTHFYNVTAFDYANNQNYTETRTINLDFTSPRITGISPANNSASISIITNFTINFSENITFSTLSNINFILVDSKGFNITATFIYNASNQSVIIPDISLTYNETYNLTFRAGIIDLAGNNLTSTSFNFTTETNPFNSSNSIIGNLSFVKTNIPEINITINGSDTYNIVKNDSLSVIIANKTHRIVELNISFSSVRLDLTNITVRQNPNTTAGSLIVRGIPLFAGINKTIYIDNLTDLQGVCIKDAEIININQISSNCKDQNETFLRCPGTFKQYGCELNGSRYKVTGLAHSGVMQSNDTGIPIVTAISTSNSGSTITLSVTTDENATCKFDESDAIFASMTYSMTDSGIEHTGTRTYSSSSSGTYYVRCNDTNGNVMSSSNTTSFSISISSGSSGSSSSSGGGGGGGGGTTLGGIKAEKLFDIIQPEVSTAFKIKNDKLAVTSIEFVTSAMAENVNFKVEKINDSKVPIKPDNVLQYLNFSTSNLDDSNIKLAAIEFKVSKKWLSDRGLSRDDIVAKRFRINSWDNLPTSMINESVFDYTYKATTPGFSIFAIIAEKRVEATAQEAKKSENISISISEVSNKTQQIEEKVGGERIKNISAKERQEVKEEIKAKKPNILVGMGIIILTLIIGLITYLYMSRKRSLEYHIKKSEGHLLRAKEYHLNAKSQHEQKFSEKAIQYHRKAAKHHKKVATHLRRIKQIYHISKAEKHEELAKHHEEIIKHIKDKEHAKITQKLKAIDEKLKSL